MRALKTAQTVIFPWVLKAHIFRRVPCPCLPAACPAFVLVHCSSGLDSKTKYRSISESPKQGTLN